MGKQKKDNKDLLKIVQAGIKTAQEATKSATKSMQQSAETLRTASPKTSTSKATQSSAATPQSGLAKLGTITKSNGERITITPPYLSMPSAPKSTAAPTALQTAAVRAGASTQEAAQRKTQPAITLGATKQDASTPQAANQRATRNLMFPAIGSLPLKSEAQDDKTRLIRNSALWHTTKDPTEQARFKAENDTIRARNNWTYQPGSGSTMAARAGLPLSKTDNLTLPVTMQFGTAAQKTDAEEAQRQMRTPEAATKRRESFQTNEALEEAAKEIAYKYGFDMGKPQNENALNTYIQRETARQEQRMREHGASEEEIAQTMNAMQSNLEQKVRLTKSDKNSILRDMQSAGASAEDIAQMTAYLNRHYKTDYGTGERILDTIDAANKGIRGGKDAYFNTSQNASYEKAEETYFAGKEPGVLNKIALKNMWGEDWESIMQAAKRAYDEGDAEGIAEYEARRDRLKNTGYGWELEDAAAQMANAKSGLTNGQGKALDMLNMGATLLGEATINGVGGGGNKLFRFGSSLSAAGRATRDAAQDGVSARDQLTYGNMIGGINYAVEGMGGIAGNGLAGKVLPEGARTALAKAGNSTLGKIAGNFFEEGMEEVIQGEAERHAGNILLGRDQKFDAGEAANSFLMGGTMGGLFGAAQAGMQAIDTRLAGRGAQGIEQAAQTQAEALPDAVKVQGAEQTTQAGTKEVRVGKGTTIQHPYQGDVPTKTADTRQHAVEISSDALVSAQELIDFAQTQQGFKSTIRKAMKDIFNTLGGQRKVSVQGLEYHGQPYDVWLNPNISTKLVSDPGMTAEKIAAFYKLDNAVEAADYVGSGQYGKNKSKAADVVRYDYFENTINIAGQPYLMKFDVEVFKDRNNFRTYRVVNNIDLMDTQGTTGLETASLSATQGTTGHETASPSQASGLSTDIVAKNADTVNPAAGLDLNALAEARMGKPISQLSESEAQTLQAVADGQDSPFADIFDPQSYISPATQSSFDMTFPQAEPSQQMTHIREIMDNWDDVRRSTQNDGRKLAAVLEGTDSVQRASKAGADVYVSESTVNQVIDYVDAMSGQRQFLERLGRAWGFDEVDYINASEMAAGRQAVNMRADKEIETTTYARLLMQYKDSMKPVHDYNKQVHAAREKRAGEIIGDMADWKDAKMGLTLATRTPERVLRKVLGDTAQAEQIYQDYFAPVHKHTAEQVRWENQYRAEVQEVMKGLNKYDSQYIHLKNRAEHSQNNDTLQVQYGVDKYKNKIHVEQAQAAESKLVAIMEKMYPEINEARVRNGLEPLEHRQNYIPSLTPTKEGKWYNRLARYFGVETMTDALPDDIAGRTADRRPGQNYAGFANVRTGVNTEFDALKAIDNYISNASNVVFHTDDIQNLRILEETIRYQSSSETQQAQMDAVKQNPTITIGDRTQQMSEIWENSTGNLPHFPSWIAEYTNILAGKKTRGDRSVEENLNRGVFRGMSDLEGKIAGNMVGGNLSTALSNFIPLAQGSGELSKINMMRAMVDYASDVVKGDSTFTDTSDFLTKRRGSDSLVQPAIRKASDLASAPMQIADNISSEILTRARYMDNLKRGLNQDAALTEADRWAAGLMADRSRGAMPNLFYNKSPITKVFTMFQLEVANQYDYLFGDIPHNAKAQGKGKAAIIAHTASALTQIFILSHLYNDAREELTGTRGAFDPIEIVNDFAGKVTGYAMPSSFDMLREATGDGLTLEDFETEKTEGKYKIAMETAQDIASEMPFISGIAGSLFGASNTRYPVQSVIPDVSKIASAYGKGSDAFKDALYKEGMKPVYGILFPFGGTQTKKTIDGVSTVRDGGSYGYDNDGNRVLQFPKFGQNPWDYAQAAMFGKWSSKEAQDYVDSGFKTLNATQTEVFDTLRGQGADAKTVYDAVREIQSIKSDKDADGKSLENGTQKKQDYLFSIEGLSAEQKQYIDEKMISTGENAVPASYTDALTFRLSSEYSETQREDAIKATDAGISLDTYAQFESIVTDMKEEGKNTGMDYTRNVAEIINTFELTQSQKDVLFQTYTDNMEQNPFHVSEYEQTAIDNNMQFYASLTDSGKQIFRAYANAYEQNISEGKSLDGWEGKTLMAQQDIGLDPSVYISYHVALSAANNDGSTSISQEEAQNAVNLLQGLTQQEKAYLFQSTNLGWKKNPFGSATVTKYVDPSEEKKNPIAFGDNVYISSYFGYRNALTSGASTNHQAIDIAAPAGTEVTPVKSGTIAEMSQTDHGDYGVWVKIDHGDGRVTQYSHLQNGSLDHWNLGDEVGQDTVIGYVGSTGTSTGPHLDLKYFEDGQVKDPLLIIAGYDDTEPVTTAYVPQATSGSKGSSSSKGSSGGSSGTLKSLGSLSGLKKLK